MAKQEGVGQQVAQEAAAKAFGEPKPRSSKKLLVFVILPLVLLLAGGGAYYVLFMKKKQDDVRVEEKPPPPHAYVYYNLPAMTVPLNGSRGRASFLAITVSLELDSATDVPLVQAKMPRIMDNMQTFLRELRAEDLKGTAQLARLRAECLDRVNAAAPTAKVNNVLLLNVLLQ